MTEEKKIVIGLRNMKRRIEPTIDYLKKNAQPGDVDRASRDMRLLEKAADMLEGAKTRLMTADEVFESPETLIWLEHYRYIDNGPVLTPTAMYPCDGEDADGYVNGNDEGVTTGERPRIMDFYCGDVYQAGDYGTKFRCWIGDMPSDVLRASVPWDDQMP